jgi:hypothetical protein
VKPYVKRQKNDAADAEAICEVVTRANMRFVATKTPEQQSGLMLDRMRHLFIRQQTAVINAIRAHLAEFGIVAPVGRNGVEQLLHMGVDRSWHCCPDFSGAALLPSERVLAGWPVQTTSRVGVLSWARMTTMTHQSTIDVAEPGREVERAAEIFVRGECGIFPPQAIASLRMAIELTMIVVLECSRHEAERAVINEFLTRIRLKLADADDAADVIRRAREHLNDIFSIRN